MLERHIVGCSALVVIGLFAAPEPGWAQQPASRSSRAQVEDVVVTAKKRSSSVQKTAIPIDVVSGSQMLANGDARIDETLKDVPGVQVETDGVGPHFIIRGLTNNGSPTAPDPAAIYIDGIYSPDTEARQLGDFDIARVEVLKGPQGTLYGANSLGGTINIISNDPVLNRYMATVSAEVGNYNLYRGEAAVNVPIGDQFALRVAIAGVHRDGYLSNGADDQKNIGGRVKLLYQPNADLKIVLSAIDSVVNGDGPGEVYWDTTKYRKFSDVPNPWRTTDFDDERSHNSVVGAQANIDWQLPFVDVTLISGWQMTRIFAHTHTDEDGAIGGDQENARDPQVTDELRLNSKPGAPFRWTLGAYYQHRDFPHSIDPIPGIPGLPPDFAGDARQVSESKSLYADITYPIVNWLRLNVGARYSIDDRSTTGRPAAGGVYKSNSYYHTTWKAGLEADVNPTTLAYVSASTGYRAGGFFPDFGGGAPAFGPESLTAYEGGIKTRLLGNRLLIDTDAFLYNFKNYQLSSTDLGFTDGGVACTAGFGGSVPCPAFALGVPNARNYGLELSSVYLVTQDDKLSANMTLEHSTLGGIPAGQVVSDPTTGGLVSASLYSDLPQDHAPDWSFNFAYTHTVTLANGATIAATGDEHVQDGQWIAWQEGIGVAHPGSDSRFYQPSYHMTNLQLLLTSPDNRWTLSTYIKNVENYPVIQAIGGSDAPTLEALIGAPRTFGAVLTWKLN